MFAACEAQIAQMWLIFCEPQNDFFCTAQNSGEPAKRFAGPSRRGPILARCARPCVRKLRRRGAECSFCEAPPLLRRAGTPSRRLPSKDGPRQRFGRQQQPAPREKWGGRERSPGACPWLTGSLRLRVAFSAAKRAGLPAARFSPQGRARGQHASRQAFVRI